MGQTGGAGGQAGQGGGLTAFVPIILMFVIFYFLLIRPQQKKAKSHQEMINNLKKGDRVITSGGIYGLITNIDETTATLEIAEKVRIKVTRSSIAGINVEAPVQASKKE
jgi:preprotein translocase subunit YajC